MDRLYIKVSWCLLYDRLAAYNLDNPEKNKVPF
jgi:hypothetical protein